MTHTDAALADLTAAQDAFDPVSDELSAARAAFKRSRTAANLARFHAAEAAFAVALMACDVAHADVEQAEARDAADAFTVELEARLAAEPCFL